MVLKMPGNVVSASPAFGYIPYPAKKEKCLGVHPAHENI